jgi:hypothetical protein
MVQLWVGWDVSATQPVYNCLALHGLRRALARKDVSIFMSSAPGNAGWCCCMWEGGPGTKEDISRFISSAPGNAG